MHCWVLVHVCLGVIGFSRVVDVSTFVGFVRVIRGISFAIVCEGYQVY